MGCGHSLAKTVLNTLKVYRYEASKRAIITQPNDTFSFFFFLFFFVFVVLGRVEIDIRGIGAHPNEFESRLWSSGCGYRPPFANWQGSEGRSGVVCFIVFSRE